MSRPREKTSTRGRIWLVTLLLGAGCLACVAALATAAATPPPANGKPSAEAAKPAPAKPAAPKAEPANAAFSLPAVPAPPPEPEAVAPAGSGSTGTSVVVPTANGHIQEWHVKNDDLNNVFETLSALFKINIVPSRGVKGKVSVDLYNVTVDQALDAICRSAGIVWTREEGTIYVQSPEEAAARQAEESRLVAEVVSLNYLSAEEAQKLVAPVLSSKGVVAINTAAEKGIPTGEGGGTGGNSLALPDTVVIRDFPERVAAALGIIAKMDRKPRQVLVEATILQVTLNDKTSLGVDFNTLAGIDFRDLSNVAVPVTDPTTLANTAATTANAALSPWGQVRTEGFATPGKGLNIGVITNNISFFINALEEVKDTTVLSNPKVLALNKQRSEVIVGDRLGYRTSTATSTTTIDTIEFLNTGTTLTFRPFISDDGYVRLEIHPKVSSGDVVGGLPNERTTEVTCNILVKDGHTVVIGGMFDETVGIGRSQVPGLGNIPGLGWLFRNKEDSSVRREIIVLLTPHIIEDEEASNVMGEQFKEDAKRRCLGLREGFTWFTRERITVVYMQQADKAWQAYRKTGVRKDLDCAWWNISLALNVAPGNLKAMRLKDAILTERRGEPHAAPNWTIWDNIEPRLKAMDEAKAKAAVTESAAKADAAKAETPKAAVPAATPATEKKPPAAETKPSATEKKPPAPTGKAAAAAVIGDLACADVAAVEEFADEPADEASADGEEVSCDD